MFKIGLIVTFISMMSCIAVEDSLTVAGEKGYQAGVHYELLNPTVETGQGDKIVVQEYFWYGCPACRNFETFLKPWQDSLASDVVVEKIPATPNDITLLHAQIYYVRQSIQSEDDLDSDLFDLTIRIKNSSTEDQIKEFGTYFEEYQIGEDSLRVLIQSTDIQAKVDAAVLWKAETGAASTPTVVVDGKYIMNISAFNSYPDYLNGIDYVVEQIRQDSL